MPLRSMNLGRAVAARIPRIGKVGSKLPQLFFHLPFASDIGVRAEAAHNRPGCVADAVHAREEPPVLAILATQREGVLPVQTVLDVILEFTSDALKVNFLWLEHYVDEGAQTQNRVATPNKVNRVWFDDVVVARSYIGPVKPIGASTAK